MYKKLLITVLLCLSTHAQSAVVAIMGTGLYSSGAIEQFLISNGHTVVYNEATAPNAQNLTGVDAVIALRTNGNDDVKNFVLGGGLLITEWTSAAWAVNTAGLLDAHAGNRIEIPQSQVTMTEAGIALGLGARDMPTTYADLGRSDVITPFTGLGEGVDVLSALPGGEAAIIGGPAGSGYVIANSLDWADFFSSANTATRTWLLNALDVKWGGNAGGSNTVPEPAALLLIGFGLGSLLLARRRTVPHQAVYNSRQSPIQSEHTPLFATLLSHSPSEH